jgi:RHS repeat-associated protein
MVIHSEEDPVALAKTIAATYGARLETPVDGDSFMMTIDDSMVERVQRDPRVGLVHATAPDPIPLNARLSNVPAAVSIHRIRANTSGEWTTGTYQYDAAGNIKQIGADQFRYDRLSRIMNSTVMGTTQAFTYDRYGNLESITTGTTTIPLSVDTINHTNRLTAVNGNSVAYDDAGQIVQMQSGSRSYAYDGVGMLTSFAASGSPTTLYIYTPSDERIASVLLNGMSEVSSSWTFRDASGKVLRRFDKAYDASASQWKWTWREDYIYAGSQMLAAENDTAPKTVHYFTDHLGSPRLITDGGGMQVGQHAYLPFGGAAADSGLNDAKRFTAHERDASGLDYMHARYYDWGLGRFLSVDPNAFWELQSGSDEDRAKFRSYLRHPQRWNRYAYVSNNPINKIDPDGREENFYMEQLFREQQMVGEGKMTEDQYWARRRSEGYGALIGTAGAGGWLLGVRAVTMGYTAFQAWRAASAAATTIKIIEQTSRGDARIFQTAMNFARGSANNFMNNLTALSRAVEQVVGPQGRITQIGTIGGQAVWGSARTGYGITVINGVTKIVQMIGDDKYRIIGNFR